MSGNSPIKHCRDCPAWRKSVFSELSDPCLDRLARAKTALRLDRGEPLFRQGEPYAGIFCIGSGGVKIAQSREGGRESSRENPKDVIVRVGSAGDTAGHRSIFNGTHYRGGATALDAVEACRISAEAVQELMVTQPAFLIRLVSKLIRDIENAERRLYAFASMPVRQRVAETLLMLRESHGVPEPREPGAAGGIRLAIGITRGELATLLGAAEETLIRFLSELRDDGVIRQDGRAIVIIDSERLERIARGKA